MADIESVKLPDGSIYNIKSGGSNDNLLLNGWFRVNQRGFTSATVSGAHRTSVDRWELWVDGTYSLSNNQMSLSSGAIIAQNFETEKWNELDGETLTLSVMLSDGTIHSGTAVFSSSQNVAFITDGSVVNNSGTNKNMKAVVITVSSAATIKAVKLEKGVYSTLHLDNAPNDTIELIKCQKYFRRWGSNNSTTNLALGYSEQTTEARFIISLPVPMRDTPTISTVGTFKMTAAGTDISITSITVHSSSNNQFVTLKCSCTGGLTTGNLVKLYSYAAAAYIDIDADIKYQ